MDSGDRSFTQEEDSIADNLAFIMCEVSPCDGCGYRQRCAAGMACSVFFHYVQTGIVDRDRKDGTPTVGRYQKLFLA